jgi:RHS repeat-associated protein
MRRLLVTVLVPAIVAPTIVTGPVRAMIAPGAVTARAATNPMAAPPLATTSTGPNGTCGLCVLATSGTSLSLTGNASMVLNQTNVLVNSTDPAALLLTSNGSLQAPSVGVSGGVSVTGKGTIANLTTGVTPIADPMTGTATPTLARPPSVPSVSLGGTATKAIFPGVYQNIAVFDQAALTLNSGTYVVLHDFSMSGQGSVRGRGITIYLACSSYPTPCGSGQQGGTLELTGKGTFSLVAPTGVCSASSLAIQSDPNNTSTIQISGQGKDTLTGAVYAKSGSLVVTGLGSRFSLGGQVVVGTGTINGNGAIAIPDTGALASSPTITLAPSASGPDQIGTSQKLTATLVDHAGKPIANERIGLTVTGANSAVTSGLTDTAGQVALSYVGVRAGTDTARAFFGNGVTCVGSNTASISWRATRPPVATGPVQGNFFAEPSSAQSFVATPASTPLFGEQFPVVDFNPPSGMVPGNTSGVGPTTRPFTDVTTNVSGDFTGTIPAQGNGTQAGVGNATTFDAALTSSFTVSAAGDVAFTVIVDDGFILGVGNGATGVKGPNQNPPSSGKTSFSAYPVLATWNSPGTGQPTSFPVTIHFPAAGTYPYELDYFSCCGQQLSLVLAVTEPAQPPPLAVSTGYADTERPPGNSTFPNPWQGSPGVTFVGSPNPDAKWDSGGLRFDNTSDTAVTLGHVTVDIGSNHFDPGFNNIVVPPHGIAVLAGKGPNFDTSDALAAPTPTASQSYHLSVSCGQPVANGQQCGPIQSFQVATTGALQLDYVNDNNGGCTPGLVHFYVDGNDVAQRTSGPPPTYSPDTGIVDVGPVSSGEHTVGMSMFGLAPITCGFVNYNGTFTVLYSAASAALTSSNQPGPLAASGYTVSNPPTARQVNTAIADAVDYIDFTQQNPNGSFGNGGNGDVAETAAAVIAYGVLDKGDIANLPTQQANPTNPSQVHNFQTDLTNAVTWLLSQQDTTDPISSGNYGGSWSSFGSLQTYSTGLALMALSTASTVPTNPSGAVANAIAHGRAFLINDFQGAPNTSCTTAGSDPSSAYCGGWNYEADFGRSDESNTGYALTGLELTGGVPPAIAQLDAGWQNNVQADTTTNPAWSGAHDDGGGSYQPAYVTALGSCCSSNANNSGTLLFGFGYDGVPSSDARVQKAIQFSTDVLDTYEKAAHSTISQSNREVVHVANPEDGSCDPSASGCDWQFVGDGGYHYSLFALSKGMGSFIPPTCLPGASGCTSTDGSNWYAKVADLLVNQQDTNTSDAGGFGSWPVDGRDDFSGVFATGLAVFALGLVGVCSGNTSIPQVQVTVAGVTTTYADTHAILTAGGQDGECGGNNESHNWAQLNPGAPTITIPTPPVLTLALTPTTTPGATVGKAFPISVGATDSSGQAVSGLSVQLQVFGANAQQLNAVTDAAGNAAFSYTGTNTGTDQVTAIAFVNGAREISNTLNIAWTIPLPPPGGTSSGSGAPLIFGLSPAAGTVVAAATPVSATIQAPSGFTIASWSLTSQLLPSGSVAPISAGNGAPPSPLGTFNPTGKAPGTYALTVSATSSGGGTASAVTTLVIPGASAPAAQAAPSITQPSPPDGTVITSPVPVQATFTPPSGESIASWNVTYQALDAEPPATLASGTGSPPSPLATFDPTLLPNDTYVIAISGTASGGGTQTLTTTVSVYGNLKLGRYVTTYQDLSVPVNGFQMEVRRTYDSTDKRVGDFGVGWHVSISNFRTGANRQLGAGGWTEYAQGCFILCSYAFKTSTPHYVTVTWPDGHQEIFDLTPNPTGLTLIDFTTTTAAFTARPGTNTTSMLTATNAADQTVTNGGDGNLYDGSGNVYNPTRFTLTTHDGHVYVLDTTLGLVSETDSNGNSIKVDSAGLHSSNGESILFTRDSSQRITQINGPSGQILKYTFSPTGDLATSTDANGNPTTYAYDTSHNLLSATGTGAKPLQTITYDSSGRITSITDADGNTSNLSSNVPGQQQVITDATGKLTIVFTQDALGDVIQQDEVFGGQTLTTTFAYDSEGRPVSRSDPNGLTWSTAYDAVGDLASVTSPAGHNAPITYGSFSNPLSYTDPSGAIKTLAYDSALNLTSVTDGLGHAETYTYDSSGHPLTRIDRDGNKWSSTYDSSGHLAAVTDPLGHKTTYSYDASGNLLSSIDTLGNRTGYTYDGNGNLTSKTDPLGRVAKWAYDSLNHLTSMTDPAGKTTSWGYDGAGKVVSKTDPLGRVTTYAYDADGRLTSTKDLTGALTQYAYDGLGRLISTTDPIGRMTSYSFDADSRLVKTTHPDGGTVTTTYDADSNPITVTDPLGRTTTSAFDAAGRLLSSTDPAGRVTKYQLDALGQQVTITDPLGQVITQVFDPLGQLTSVTDPANETSTTSYDAAGNVTKITDPLGRATTETYDADNRLTSQTDPAGHTTSYGYDAVGNRVTVTDALGKTTTYAYDALNRLTSATDPLGHVTSTAYDADGETSAMTDANGHTTAYGYDAAGRQTSMMDAAGGTLTLSYDAAGQRTGLTDPLGHVTAYAYDLLGDVVKVTDPLKRVMTSTYDKAREMVSTTDGRGITTTYSYDPDGELTSMAAPSRTVSFAYTADGQRSSMTDPTGKTTYTYDAAGRMIQAAAPAGTVTYGYDAAGERTSMTMPGPHTITYTYDAASNLASIGDWAGHIIGFGYDANNQPTSVNRSDGLQSALSYDAAGHLLDISHGPSGSLGNYSYSYDPAGNRTSVTSVAGTENYTLDSLNRLANATYPNGDVVSYSYDAAGNRVSTTVNGITTKATFDAANELTVNGSTTYTYDGAGNETSAGSTTYTWDSFSDLSSSKAAGTTTSYSYDGDGLRASATTGSTTTSYLWDSQGGLPTVVSNGTQSYLQVPGAQSQAGGTQAQIDKTGNAQYLLADALGSIRAIADSTGASVGNSSYDAYGGVRSQSGATSIFGFAGQQTDSTGLQYLRARYLDPSTGRFISADPTVASNAPTLGYNRYLYALDSPTTLTDPSGHQACIEYSLRTVLASVGAFLLRAAIACALLAIVVPFVVAMLPSGVQYTLGSIQSAIQSIPGIGWLFSPGPRVGPIDIKQLALCVALALFGKLLTNAAKDPDPGIPNPRGTSKPPSIGGEQEPINVSDPHVRELGMDPAKGFQASEAETGTRLEQDLGITLARYNSADYEWVNPATGKTYDAVGNFPSQFFDLQQFETAILKHLRKSGLDYTVVDMSTFTSDQIAEVRQFINGLQPADQSRIIQIPAG